MSGATWVGLREGVRIFGMTILTSVLVSAFVTLLVEWLAKPSLEARKARILEDLAARRKALRTCRSILKKLGALRVDSVHAASFLVETRTSLDDMARRLDDEITDVALQLPFEGQRLAGRAVGYLRGALKSDRTHLAVSADCREPFEALAHILETSSALSPGRRVAIARASAWLASAPAALPSPEGPDE